MPLKRHHKIIIGGFSTAIIIFIIVSSILTYTLFVRQELTTNQLENKIKGLETDTQAKINELTINLLDVKSNVDALDTQLGSIDEEFTLLKASAGEDFSGIIEDSVKSVVTIRTDVSQGTGFIITDDGYVVTNAHVLSGAKYVESLDYHQNTIPTTFVGYSEDYDIALLKLNGNYEELKLDDSDDVQIGEKVIAIGNPLGLQFSVTEGIVSGVHRPGLNTIPVYIQTDAALNPGNSGGPLINKQGKVIGINNFKIGEGESLGFALESNYIKDVVNKISTLKLNQTLV